jgi:hypothetical protein
MMVPFRVESNIQILTPAGQDHQTRENSMAEGFVQRHQHLKHPGNIVSDLDTASYYLVLLNDFGNL